MFNNFSKKAVSYAAANNYVSKDDKEDYIYGFNIFLTTTINIVSMLLIGFVMRMFWECLLFCLVYKCMRKYVGGYHAKTGLRCYITSCVMYAAVLFVLKYITFPAFLLPACVIITSCLLLYLAPVDAINKPLDEIERKVFGKRARITIAITFAVYCIALMFKWNHWANVIAISVILVALFAGIGKIELARHEKRTAE